MIAQGFHVMVKPAGAACNIDCDYCYFLSKDQLYPGRRHRMSDSTLERHVRQTLECHGGGEVGFAWQGGEPTLLGVEFYRRAVQLAEKYRRPDQVVRHSIQTNGLLLDEKWCIFLKKHGFLVGISLDGPRDLHDVYRKDKRGRGTFDLVMKAVERLKQYGVDFNILCTVNAANQHHGARVYRFFRDNIGAEWIQFIPLVERAEAEGLDQANAGWRDDGGHRDRPLYLQRGDRAVNRSTERDGLGRFLVDVFDIWIAEDVGRIHVQHFEAMLGALYGQHLSCTHAPTCGRGLALEHNGDLYCCDHYVEPDYRLGNITKQSLHTLLAARRLQAFGHEKLSGLTRQCQSCPVRIFCHGGCPKDRFDTAADGEAGHNYLCASFKTFFGHARPAIERIAALLRAGRPASDVMRPSR
jgi:uncharacterized protein